MEKEQLIISCKKIIREIRKHNKNCEEKFFICVDSHIPNVCEHIVPILGRYGNNHIDKFEWTTRTAAFNYNNGDIFIDKEYNNAKINHIKEFIKYINKGGIY